MKNPFRPTKFEWEDDPQIWLSPTARSLTQSLKPVYISGTRGSGKTTILRSLSSKILLESDFLRLQFSTKSFTWFGVYLQFNRNLQFYTSELSQLLNSARSESQPEISEYEVFSKYFEVSLLSAFLEEAKELESRGILHTKAANEREACRELESIFVDCDIPGIKMIEDFSDARRLCEKILDIFLARDYDYSPEFVRRIISAFRTGRLIRLVKSSGVPALSSANFRATKPLELFILIDDCESLSSIQQRALNTYIRQTEGEAKWVVSFLSGQFNTTDTFLPNTSLIEADRDIIRLNSMSDKDFTNFCEKVADIRIKGTIMDNVAKRVFDEKSFSFGKFGDYSYNDLCEESLRRSQSKHVRRLREDVAHTKARLRGCLPPRFFKRFHCDNNQSPFIEHILLTDLDLDVEKYVREQNELTLLQVIARKQVAAFIYLCRSVNTTPRLFGKNVASAFSDTTIRDFLDLMAEVFAVGLSSANSDAVSEQTLAKRTRSFLNTSSPIPMALQDSAIRRASVAKFQSVEALASSTEPHIANFVRGIGYLTRELHGLRDRPSALRVAERGVFRINVDAVDAQLGESSKLGDFLRIARRTERDGFVKIVEMPTHSEPFIRLRIHKRLCPFFECSPRSAYETVTLSTRDVVTMLMWEPDRDIEKWCEDWVEQKAAQGEFRFGGLE